MNCPNILVTYKEWVAKQKAEGHSQEELDKVWLDTLFSKRNGNRLELLKKITDPKGNEEYSNVVAVQYNGAEKSNSVRLLDVKPLENGRFQVFVENGSYEFEEGKVKSEKTYKGQYIVMPAMSLTKGYELDSVTTLGSKADDSKIDWSKFNRIENTIHGNVGKMQELLEELHKLGGEKESTEHLEYLKDLIGKMNPRFFKKMKTYIDEKAKSTGGIMTSTKVGITISKADKLAGNQQSEAEVYTHEVVHSYVAFALEAARSGNVEARALLRELEYAMKVAREQMSWRNFLPDVSIDKELEEKNAKEMYEYIFNSKNAEDEFVAHVLTNPKVMERAKKIMLKDKVGKSLWERVKGIFSTLLDLVSGNYEFNDRKKNVYDMTMDLTFRLAEYNTKALREAKSRESLGEIITNAINGMDAQLGDKLEEFADKWMPKGSIPPKPSNKIAQAKWYGEVLTKMVLNPTYRKQLSKWAYAFGMSPEGTIQTIMRDFTEQDALSKSMDWVALQSDRIDGAKMSLIAATSEAVTAGFKKTLSKESRKALTRVVVDTDLESIYDRYKNAELRKMLTDDAELEKRIGRAKHRLEELDPKWYNWYAFQANGLGRYLATGEAHIAQNFSAMNIARGLLTAEYRSPSKQLVQAIDEVATLVALQYTAKADKANVAQLLLEDRKGVSNVIAITKNLKAEASKTVFKDGSTHMMKGYSKEVFDDRVTMEVDTIANKDEMAKRGFKLVKVLKKHSGDTSGMEFGMYVSNMFGTNEFYRTSTRLTKLQSKGTSLKELAYAAEGMYAGVKHKTNKLKLDRARTEMITKAIAGTLDVEAIEYGLAPILNEDGAVVDYRYVINKSAKEDYLGMESDVATILGRTKGHTFDKHESVQHNEKVLEIIKKDAEENYVPGMTTGKNDEIYVLIGPDSTDEKIKDLWDILPKSFKEEAMNNKEKGLPVRRDLMNVYFGYRHLSLVDFPGLSKITPTMIKSLIKIAETLWMEFIKISKVDVLIKMPFVMVGNIVSNFMYAVMTGSMNPAELLQMYVKSTRDVRDYLRKHKELVRLQVARDTGNSRKLDIGKIAQLERELANNPVHELYQLGIYQAIVEDVNTDEFTSTNKLKQMYKDKTEGVPKIIKDGMNWMYLTEETQYYKFMTEVLQMSDLVARDIENRKLKAMRDKQLSGGMKLPRWFLKDFPGDEKRKLTGDELKEFKKRSDEMRLDTVLNAFINYNKPSGSLEEYLNKVGLVMFTKYAKRIQRVISTTGAKYPIKSLLVLLGQEFVMDVETIQDQSVFTRSWYNMGISEHDLVPGKALWDYVMEVFTPPVFQGSTYKLL